MKKIFILLSCFFCAYNLKAQNIGINTTGLAPTTPSMLEILQPSTTVSSAGLYVNHTGAVAGVGNYGYAIQAIKNGAGVNNVALYLSATAGTTGNYALLVPAASGLVGIGLLNPTMLLDVSSASTTASDAAIRGASTGTGVILFGVRGSVASATTDAAGVYGSTSGNGQVYGVLGTTSATTGNASGVRGYSSGATGATNGVWGENVSTTGGAAGVYGYESSSTNGTSWANTGQISGVYGRAATGTTQYQAGVFGYQSGNGANAGGVVGAYSSSVYGGLGYSDGSSNRIGVYGNNSNAAAGTNYAAYFNASGGTTNYGLYVNNGSVNIQGLAVSSVVKTDASKNLTTGTVSLTSDVTGTLPVGNGGTGATTLTGVLKGNGAAAISAMTGTTDYLARWTDANTIGIGVTRDNNSTVGINVAPNASYNLYVSGALATADNATIYGTSTGANRVYGVLGSASATTTNASGVRGSATGAGLVNGVWGEANGAAAVAGVYGSTTSITNGATGVSGSASGASGIISGVVGFTNSTTTYATGVYGEATVGGADAIDGYNSAAAGASDGYGVWGITLQSAGFGVAANNWNSAGTGVLGMGNNTATFWNPNSAGAGGIFNGLRYGIVSGIDNENTAGTGYGFGAVYSSVEGVTETNVGANATLYHFAIHGINNDYGVAYGLRTGGVLGRESYTGAWGCLGYQTSASANRYGSYATSSTTGAGFLSNSAVTGIGMAGYGGIIGGWTRGEVMGHISAGELFASYNLGNEYTSGFSAEVVTLSDKRVAAYSMTSTDIKVYNDGTGKLNNGKTRVDFDVSFTELIGENKPVVTITPMGQCNGIYITNVDSKGFDVIELNNGNSNVEFSYIAISKRIDSENKPALPTDLANKNFDEKMKGVMFNESDLEHSATSIWWDGTKLSFDPTTKQGDLKPLPGLEVHKKALGLKDGKAAFKKRIINEEK